MTVEKNVLTIPEKRITEIRSTVAGVNRWATITEGNPRITLNPPLTPNLYIDEIDGLIELLHAIKASIAEQAGVDVHTLEATA